jgi:hypothetical protein
MFQGSILEKSGQLWKLWAGLLLMTCGFGLMVIGLGRLSEPNGFAVTLIGLGVGLASAAFACISISCSSCGARWLWIAVKNREQLKWVHWLAAQRVCPRCGYDPAVVNPPPP